MATKKPTNKETNQPASPAGRQITILAIESSCDETAGAIVQKSENESVVRIVSSITATSLIKHKETKGIVPEVAAREQLKYILPVIEEALKEFGTKKIDAIAVTTGPGLVGSLLVGIETARALAMAWDKPIIAVNHILAHPYANFIEEENLPPTTNNVPPQFPLLSWVISGGHTELHLMKSHDEVIKLGHTVDDAAGECFDKCARVLGFDYPGGPFIEKLALEFANNKALKMQFSQETITLPRPLVHEKSFNLSFSGLKTAFLRTFNENKEYIETSALQQMMAHELQEAITDMIVKKTKLALTRHPEIKSIIVSGGVAANKRLKEKITAQATQQSPSTTVHFPSLSLCTDNAAMIGAYAAFHMDTATDWSKITLEM